jgi:4-alpha-glucanotransferase
MRFSGFSKYESGVILPVSSLRSRKSFGIGEFSDLPLLGAWCAKTGFRFIQILPMNDTGTQSSPYSALSAFALHPVYIRLQELPEFDPELLPQLDAERTRLEALQRIPFPEVVTIKEQFLRTIFSRHHTEIQSSQEIARWIDSNPWIVSYAEFRSQKKDLLFYAWVQFRAEEQFVQAARNLDRMGICLKGDLPILMSEHSADVWAFPHFFRKELRAGAPPDMFSETGQNWGFPIYNWETLEKEGYQWWKDRLKRADLFYHAYRIDHVLGFFRIWAIPEKEISGVLGFYVPSSFLQREELQSRGMDTGRIRWLSEPHIRGEEIRSFANDIPWDALNGIFQQIGQEDLYLFRSEIGERGIEERIPEGPTREKILRLYRNRFFLETPFGYAPAWYRDSARALEVLRPEEKQVLQELVSRYYRDSESLWEQTGQTLLGFMKETTGMLPCAEDLGVVPDCVPRVLEKLQILGLRIPRWTRRYKEPGEPFIPPREYPPLTVCASSVHDTTTLRQWWEEEAEREAFWAALGKKGPAPASYTPETAEQVLEGLLETSSLLAMFQFQDLLALSPDYRVKDPADERINIPGSVTDRNWTYRLPFTLEELGSDSGFTKKVQSLLRKRSCKKLP